MRNRNIVFCILIGLLLAILLGAVGCKPKSPGDGWRYVGKVEKIYHLYFPCGRVQTLFHIDANSYRATGDIQFNGRLMRHSDTLNAWEFENDPNWGHLLLLVDRQGNRYDCVVKDVEPIEE